MKYWENNIMIHNGAVFFNFQELMGFHEYKLWLNGIPKD
jgi:hypothetical protein